MISCIYSKHHTYKPWSLTFGSWTITIPFEVIVVFCINTWYSWKSLAYTGHKPWWLWILFEPLDLQRLQWWDIGRSFIRRGYLKQWGVGRLCRKRVVYDGPGQSFAKLKLNRKGWKMPQRLRWALREHQQDGYHSSQESSVLSRINWNFSATKTLRRRKSEEI